MIDFANIESYRENNRIEAKKAIGGLPESIWETYSAFANTLGGIILLGVEERSDKSFHAVDLPSPEWLLEDFWTIINDPKKVNINILSERNVTIEEINGKHIIAIQVPRAARNERPVYIDGNPFRGTYKRSGEGDHHCTREEVCAMMQHAYSLKTEEPDSYKKAIINYITEYLFASPEEIASLLSLSEEDAERIIAELVSAGIICESKHNGKKVYRLEA